MRTEGSTLTYRGALRVADDITDLVGQTPMLRLTRLGGPDMAEIFAKLEFLNPGGSIKDRAALGMILKAEEHFEVEAEYRRKVGYDALEAKLVPLEESGR